MIEINALSLGYAVPRKEFSVNVHSIFPEAINLRSRNRGRLLTLVTADCADIPQGIRIDSPPGFTFDTGLQAGERLFCQNSQLQDEHGYLSINLRPAKYWKCSLPSLAADGITQYSTAAWKSVWQALNERQKLTGAELCVGELFHPDGTKREALTESMGRLTRSLIEATRNLDPAAETIVARLIGLGPGLTPSGDDFLVGFLTGLRCTTGNAGERRKFLSALGKVVIHFSSYTNDISSTYLFYATKGQVSSKLASLVEAIAEGEVTDHFRQVAEEAMRAGHSSGMDTVTGLLVGLSTWGDEFPQLSSV